MQKRSVAKIIRATPVSEGAGVIVHRTIGTPALRNLDPFLMLDFFNSDNKADYIAGFPNHPHRGFNTFTYMLDGHMEHRDSMGNKGDLRSGAGQWMKAASGIIHSEMPKQTDGLMRGFQLWINLPAREKMSAPAYQEYAPEAFPVVANGGARVRVLIGEFAGVAAPIQDEHTHVQYWDVQLPANDVFRSDLPAGLRGFVYVFEGDATLADTQLPQHTFAVLSDGSHFEIRAGSQGARFIVVAGRPIGEPIVQRGPFVMNTEEEIHQAFEDYSMGRLVRQKAHYPG